LTRYGKRSGRDEGVELWVGSKRLKANTVKVWLRTVQGRRGVDREEEE
jgi:hypothetical protein